MTARPETLEVRHPEWGEAIVLTWVSWLKHWRHDDHRAKWLVFKRRGGYAASAWSGLRWIFAGASPVVPRVFPTPQAAADALAVLIHETPELRHLAPGGAA